MSGVPAIRRTRPAALRQRRPAARRASDRPRPRGSIAGLRVAPSLSGALVEGLSASYDRCAAEQATHLTCSWRAEAWLFPPQLGDCDPSHYFPPPTGLRSVERRVWSRSSEGDGTLRSGAFAFALEGVNNQTLCLYVNRAARQGGGPVEPLSDLVASARLHVDLPGSRQPPASSQPPLGFNRATRRLRSTLARRFASWRRGGSRRAACRTHVGPRAIRCLGIRWRRGPLRFTGRATVWMTSAGHLRHAYRILAIDSRCARSARSPSRCRTIHAARSR